MTWTETTNLKFCLLNAENLFLLFDTPPTEEALNLNESQWQRLSTSVYENKPLKKCLDLAKALNEIDADIIMLCEVGGFESLKNFNQLFMKDRYSPCLVEGNSDRNIDVGFLIRKELQFYFDLESNKHRPIEYLYPHERQSLAAGYPVKGGKVTTSHKFSRDAVELKLFRKERDKPFLNILLTHLKSRLDPERIDPNGFERRQAELKTLLSIYKEMKAKHPHVPTVVAGDFNGNASLVGTDEEFKPLYEETDLKDILEVAQLASEQRATFYQVKSNSRTEGRQIDYVFISPDLHGFLNASKAPYVFRYRDEFGMPHGIPFNMEAKLRLPSDHYPIVFELDNIPLL